MDVLYHTMSKGGMEQARPPSPIAKNPTTIWLILKEKERICKKSFLAVHGLQNNRGRLNNILKQIKSSPTPKSDMRGQHSNRPNRWSDLQVQAVHDHIKSIPK